MTTVAISPGMRLILKSPPEPAPEIGKEFAVGRTLFERLPDAARPQSPAWKTIAALGIRIDAAPFVFPDAAAAAEAWNGFVAALKELGLETVAMKAEGEGWTGPLLVLKEPSVEERFIGEDDEGLRANFRAIIAADLDSVGRFSRLTGLKMRYCFGTDVIQPPLPKEEGVVHIFMGARPPGNFRHFSQRIKDLFGVKAWNDGETRMVHGPTPWRGRIVSAEGVPIFQIVDGNAYHLAMVLSDNSNLLDRNRMWDESLALLARALAPDEAGTAVPAPMPVESLPERVRAMARKRGESHREALRKIEFELGDLQRRFSEKLRERDEKAIGLRALERGVDEMAERSADDFARLAAMMPDDLVDVRVDEDEGLMADTVPVALERDGRRYDLGPFRIHLSPEGQVAVWSEAPRHPKGHHHPHIDKTNLECFGDITLAVAKYASSYRFADAVKIIVRWLRSYRPETTLIPLEEFPSEPIRAPKKGADRGERKHAQPLAAAQAAGPEGRPPRDADRRGGDRKPRRRRARQAGRAETDRLGRR